MSTDPIAPSDSTGPDICPNCGADFQGLYCSNCGQKDQPLRQSAFHFIRDALVEVIGIDGRLWRTLGMLFGKPGGLTTAFIDGRRTQYIRPLRLYLTATVLFFFLISLFDPVGRVQRSLNQRMGIDSTATVSERLQVVSLRLENDANRILDDESNALAALTRFDRLSHELVVDSSAVARAQKSLRRSQAKLLDVQRNVALRKNRFEWQRSVLEKYPPDSTIRPFDLATASNHVYPGVDSGSNSGSMNIGLPEWALRNDELRRARDAKTNTERMNAIMSFGKGTIRRIPAVLFVLLPFFALMLKLLYAKSRLQTIMRPAAVAAAMATGGSVAKRPDSAWYYTEHLVFGLHSHAFLFFVFAVIAVLVQMVGWIPWVQLCIAGLLLWMYVYFVLAMKRVYRQGWMKTLFKAAILGSVYQFMLLSVGFVLAILFAALLG